MVHGQAIESDADSSWPDGLEPFQATQACGSNLLRATLLRLAAQDRIVREFREQLVQDGAGPSESELRAFARLAADESRLSKKFDRLLDKQLGDRLAGLRPELTGRDPLKPHGIRDLTR